MKVWYTPVTFVRGHTRFMYLIYDYYYYVPNRSIKFRLNNESKDTANFVFSVNELKYFKNVPVNTVSMGYCTL